MIKQYKKCTIKIYRAKSIGGWSDLYYSCFRDHDKLEVCSGCGGLLGISNAWGIYRYIKHKIDSMESCL